MRIATDQKGFTIVELLVVLAIVAILSTVLLPAFTSTQRNSRQNGCMANIKHIVMAMRIDYLHTGKILPGPDYLNSEYLPGTPDFWAARLLYTYDAAENAYQRNDRGIDIGAFRCPSDDSSVSETVGYSKKKLINGQWVDVGYIKSSPVISGNISYANYNPPTIMNGFVDDLWSLAGCDSQERPLPFCGKSDVRPAKSTRSDHGGVYIVAYIGGNAAIYRSKDATIVSDWTEKDRQDRIKDGKYVFIGRD